MKNNILFTTIFFFFSLSLLTAQAPTAFNYQGEARQDGNIVTDPIDLRLSLIQGDLNGPVVYQQELSDVEPNAYGQLSVHWGKDQPGLDTVDWQNGPFFQRVEIRLDGGDYVDLGTSQLLSVPYAMYAENSGNNYWSKQDTNIYKIDGYVGVGTNTPTVPLHIHTMSDNQGLRLSTQGLTESVYLHLVENSNGEEYGYLHLGGNTSLRGNGKRSVFDGSVGIGTSNPQGKLHVNSNGELIRLEGSNHAYISFFQHPNNEDRSGYLGYGSASNNDFYIVNDQDGSMIFRTSNVTRMIINEEGNIGVGTTDPDKKLHVNGRTKTSCLEITGGCDIKEDLNSIEELEPGDIVVIDENNPGQIKRTNQPYDKKVAGIISGANGVKPGLSLSQEDVMEGEHPLTMLGRAYVKVTGKVEIGDMLTTSSIPGHAMAVRDYSKANGTVIGKAMTENEGGEGTVLVLVNLQ